MDACIGAAICIGPIIIMAFVIFFLVKSSKKKKNEAQKLDAPQKMGEEIRKDVKTKKVKYSIVAEMLSIDEMGFFGEYSKSPNGRYILSWSDSDPEAEIVGARDKGKGCFLVLDGDNIVSYGRLERPNDGKIANNGNFIIHDWLFTDDLAGKFFAFSSLGEIIIERKFKANLDNNAISNDGRFAVCHTCNSDFEDDSNVVCIFDLQNRIELSKFHSEPCWPDKYKFNTVKKVLYIICQNKKEYRYSFDGILLDTKKLEKDLIKRSSGYDLFDIALKKLEGIESSDITAYNEIIDILEKSLKGVSEYTKANIHRKLGEIYFNCDRKEKALEHYEKALNYNPKIGLKRIVKQLKEKLID